MFINIVENYVLSDCVTNIISNFPIRMTKSRTGFGISNVVKLLDILDPESS